MDIREAISILNPETSRDALWKYEEGDERMDAVNTSSRLACDALALMEKREKGLVVELPCAVGDDVYVHRLPYCTGCPDYDGCTILNGEPCKHWRIVKRAFGLDDLEWVGKTVFLTLAEAEEVVKG